MLHRHVDSIVLDRPGGRLAHRLHVVGLEHESVVLSVSHVLHDAECELGVQRENGAHDLQVVCGDLYLIAEAFEHLPGLFVGEDIKTLEVTFEVILIFLQLVVEVFFGHSALSLGAE